MPATRRGEQPRAVYLHLGAKLEKELETIMPLHLLAQRLGTSKEGARKICIVALGKLVYRMKEIQL